MMQQDPIFGPLSREKLQELSAAPYGEALKEIRKHDPLFGLREGETITWRVRATRQAREYGYANVDAASQEEATRIAEKLDEANFSWDCDDADEFEIDTVEPKR